MKSVFVVIVLYNIKIEDSPTYQSFIRAASVARLDYKLLIFDNSPKAQAGVHQKEESYLYYWDGVNHGLSNAYNYAALKAKELNIDWLMLLDQDTEIDLNYFYHLMESKKLYPVQELFVPRLKIQTGKTFSPNYFFLKRLWLIYDLKAGEHSIVRNAFVNSGIFIRRALFESAGGYNPAVKIDFSDFEFIHRLKSKTNSFCLVNSTWTQSFSYFDTDESKRKARFGILIENANALTKETLMDRIQYWIMLLHTSIHKSLRHRDLTFLKIFFKQYEP